ncbi:hypothetical protein Tco_0006861 [Tanacetum coccineum]
MGPILSIDDDVPRNLVRNKYPNLDIMADVNALVEQAPAVAPPTRTDETNPPRIGWVANSKPTSSERLPPLRQYQLSIFSSSKDIFCYDRNRRGLKWHSRQSLICALRERLLGLKGQELQCCRFFGASQYEPHIDMRKGCGKEFNSIHSHFYETKESGTTYSGKEESHSHCEFPKANLKKSQQLGRQEFVDEGIPLTEPGFGDLEADTQRAIEESLKDAHGAPRVLPTPTETLGHDESSSLYAELGLSESDTESDEEVPPVVKSGAQEEGQAGPNPVGRTVIPEETLWCSTGDFVYSLQHLAKDFSFGDQFFNDKPSDAYNERQQLIQKLNHGVVISIKKSRLSLL